MTKPLFPQVQPRGKCAKCRIAVEALYKAPPGLYTGKLLCLSCYDSEWART